jgi:hypothetical protein
LSLQRLQGRTTQHAIERRKGAAHAGTKYAVDVALRVQAWKKLCLRCAFHLRPPSNTVSAICNIWHAMSSAGRLQGQVRLCQEHK